MKRNGAVCQHQPGPIYLGPSWIEIYSVEHYCETPSMNDDVPARDAEGRTSFYAETKVQSLYAQLGSIHRPIGPGFRDSLGMPGRKAPRAPRRGC